jgi:hypothetical protein
MSPAQAKLALKRPLVFGDRSQIEAAAVMEQVNQAVKAIRKCDHNYEHRAVGRLCACISSFPVEIIRAATEDPSLNNFTSERKKQSEAIRRSLP